ncbi:MAG: N-acetylmuramoyl-L-alanine amidase [Deltaproteobacteria bacterium]|nr:MAG: N-acetylmuramoyl-L-alanine amidase [Deltaproteobacteria bacterium]
MTPSTCHPRRRTRIHGRCPWAMVAAIVALTLLLAAPVAAASRAEALFYQAEACQRDLEGDPARQKYRHHWMRCIDKFKAVYRQDPDGGWAPAALYRAGVLYLKLARFSGSEAHRREGIDLLQRLVRRFKRSAYRSRAEALLATVAKSRGTPVKKKPAPAKKTSPAPVPAPGTAARPASGRSGGTPATVENLRFWSNPSYTRVVVDLDGATTYRHHLLKKDPEIGKPQRLFIDLDASRLGKGLQRQVPINDDLLLDARAGQYDGNTVRVVVDIKSFKTYKIFSLNNPFRIVIDVWGQGGETLAAAKPSPRTPAASSSQAADPGKLPPGALARQLALGVGRIVIDPGHGGKDFGAPGYLKGVHEKHVVLKIAKRLAKKIKARLGCEVILTRETDRFLTLEERTAIANTRNADLFISIHTNAARNRRAYGIETFFLNLATDDDAILVAARENATSEKNISDLQAILLDLMQNAKINESSRLACHVQGTLYRHMKGRYSQVRDKGVKQAPFYVLLGAQMPAILVETSFISNKRECQRLIDPKYQEHLCEGIVKGIEAYMRETNPTAFLQQAGKKG